MSWGYGQLESRSSVFCAFSDVSLGLVCRALA